MQWLHEEDQRQPRAARVAAAVGVIQQALDDDKPPELVCQAPPRAA